MGSFLRSVSCIAAMDSSRGIGKNNTLPWSLPNEYKHFIRITSTTKDPAKRNAVVMGKSTWLSIPEKFRPLRNRLNVVLSTTIDPSLVPKEVILVHSLTSALEMLSSEPLSSAVENIFIVGGAAVYQEAIDSEFDLGVFKEVAMDGISNEVQQEKGIEYRFAVYQRKATDQ